MLSLLYTRTSRTENSSHSSPLTSGPSSAPSSSPSSAPSSAPSASSVRSTKKPQEVIVDDNGVPVGWNSRKISTLMGKLVRAHIPIYYAEWKKVPRTYKNDVWSELLDRRIGHAQIEAEMRVELDDPMEDIPRHETWVKVRTRKDGTILASALPFVEKINEILKIQDESSKGSQSLDNDVLAQALEKDESRGRVRGTSKTKLKVTQSLCAKLVACRAEKNELKTHLNESRQQINNLGSRFSCFGSFMDEMRGRLPTEVVSHSPSQGFSAGTTHTEFEHHTNVAIMNMAQEVVAYGTVVKDGTSGILHGRHIKDFEVKVLLDKIILQDERLYLGTQGCADTYSEVGTGGFVVHHREFLKHT